MHTEFVVRVWQGCAWCTRCTGTTILTCMACTHCVCISSHLHLQVLGDLGEFVKDHHKTGVTWGKVGGWMCHAMFGGVARTCKCMHESHGVTLHCILHWYA